MILIHNNLDESPENYFELKKKKKPSPQKLHTTWFHLYNILKWKKIKEMKNRLVLPMVGNTGYGRGIRVILKH